MAALASKASIILLLVHRGVMDDQILNDVFDLTKDDINSGVDGDPRFAKGACAYLDIIRDNKM